MNIISRTKTMALGVMASLTSLAIACLRGGFPTPEAFPPRAVSLPSRCSLPWGWHALGSTGHKTTWSVAL